MTLRFSTGFRDGINEVATPKQLFAGGKLLIYSGSQPADADAAVTGTLLHTFTASGGAHTAEVPSSGTVTLTGGGSGSVDTLTVNSIEIMGSATAFDTSLPITATNIATKINNNPKNLLFVASASGAVVTITAKPGLGTLPNTWVVASTVTTITKTDVNMAGGVNSANGLLFGDSAAGALSKLSTQTWSGTTAVTGTAGWFRLVGAKADAGAIDSTGAYVRIDGSIATSGADMNWSNTALTASAVQTLDEFILTYPAS